MPNACLLVLSRNMARRTLIRFKLEDDKFKEHMKKKSDCYASLFGFLVHWLKLVDNI